MKWETAETMPINRPVLVYWVGEVEGEFAWGIDIGEFDGLHQSINGFDKRQSESVRILLWCLYPDLPSLPYFKTPCVPVEPNSTGEGS